MGLNIPPSDTNIFLSDIVTANATTVRHGFLKKLSGVATEFMDGAGNFSAPPGGLATSGSAFTIIGGSASGVTNGTALQSAYTAAKLATPQGAALSTGNRFTIFLLPGVYDLSGATLSLDTQFIDIVGISTNSGAVVFNSNFVDLGDTVIKSTISVVNINNVTGHDIALANLCIQNNEVAAGSTRCLTTTQAGFGSQFKVFNVQFAIGGGNTVAMQGDKNFGGTWVDVRSWYIRSFGSALFSSIALNGTFIRCKGGNNSFGEVGNPGSTIPTISGTFIDCEAGGTSFGAGSGAPGDSVLSGVFLRCRIVLAGGSLGSFMGGSVGTMSGYFEGCLANPDGTGAAWGATLSGVIRNCSGGATPVWTSVTGTVTDCSFTGWNGIYAMNVADSAAVANTVAETNFSVTKTIAIKDWRIAKAFRWEAWGKFSTDVATPGTLTIRSKFGATVLRTSGALTLLGGATNAGWMASGIFVLRTAGATGTVSTQLKIELDDSGFIGDSIVPSNGTVTINTTIANTFQLSAEWSVADTDNTITLENFVVVPEAGN